MPLEEIVYKLEQVSRQKHLKSKNVWAKENERTIAFVQSYRMGNSLLNSAYMDDILLVSSDLNLLLKSSCPQD
jgi:hypothetical protein